MKIAHDTIYELIFVVAISLCGCAKQETRQTSRFLIPQGYVGWVRIDYGVKGATPLPVVGGAYIVHHIPQNGYLKTSTFAQDGWARDEYHYASATKRQSLQIDSGEESAKSMIWDQQFGVRESTTDAQSLVMFVGNKRQRLLVASDRVGSVKATILQHRVNRRIEYKNLSHGQFSRANWKGSYIAVDLTGATLKRANLSYAIVRSNFTKADLRDINLYGADLWNVTMRSANLQNANLCEALLEGVDLRNADLTGTRLKNASYDRLTKWPKNYYPTKHGAKLVNIPITVGF